MKLKNVFYHYAEGWSIVLAVYPSQLCLWSLDYERMYYNNAPYIKQKPLKKTDWMPKFSSAKIGALSYIFYEHDNEISRVLLVGRPHKKNNTMIYNKDKLIIVFKDREKIVNADECFTITSAQMGRNWRIH